MSYQGQHPHHQVHFQQRSHHNHHQQQQQMRMSHCQQQQRRSYGGSPVRRAQQKQFGPQKHAGHNNMCQAQSNEHLQQINPIATTVAHCSRKPYQTLRGNVGSITDADVFIKKMEHRLGSQSRPSYATGLFGGFGGVGFSVGVHQQSRTNVVRRQQTLGFQRRNLP
eukprot:Clim_evm23s136 gene=Clim_evmTU23s136